MNEWDTWHPKEGEEEIATTKTVSASQFGSRQKSLTCHFQPRTDIIAKHQYKWSMVTLN